MFSKSPPTSSPSGTATLGAHQVGGDEHVTHVGVRVHLLGHQLLEHPCTLRVAHQHHAPTVVLGGHVVGERLPHVSWARRRLGGGARRRRGRRSAQSGHEAGEGPLAVHRSEHPAHLAQSGRLVERDEPLLVAGDEITGRARVAGDGRVHVEAVDRGVLGGRPRLLGERSVGCDDGRVEAVVADVLRVGVADPVGQVGVGRTRRALVALERPARRCRVRLGPVGAGRSRRPARLPGVVRSRVAVSAAPSGDQHRHQRRTEDRPHASSHDGDDTVLS